MRNINPNFVNSAIKNGKITKQFILLECISIERILKYAGYSFFTEPTLFSVAHLSAGKKQQILYGCADSQGRISINELYIGTMYFNALRESIVHEFAHLCVGVHHAHNPAFKKILKEFRSVTSISRECSNSEERMLYSEYHHHLKTFKYRIYAVTSNGTRFFYKYAEKKNSLYLGFESSGRTASYRSEPVLRFEYEQIDYA